MQTNGTVAKSVNTNIINTKTLNRRYLSFHAFMVNKESVTLEVRSKLVKIIFPGRDLCKLSCLSQEIFSIIAMVSHNQTCEIFIL